MEKAFFFFFGFVSPRLLPIIETLATVIVLTLVVVVYS